MCSSCPVRLGTGEQTPRSTNGRIKRASLHLGLAEKTRWYPSTKVGEWASFVTTLLAVAALLTNGYYLRFLEPAISRGALVVLSIALAFVVVAATHFGVPRTRAELMAALRALVVPALLATILVLAFGLREWGISSGLPQSYVADEYDFVSSALTRLKRGDFNPRWWYYPSLQTYLASATYLGVFLAKLPSGAWESIHQVHEEDMIYWGRFLSVAFGTLTVFLTYVLGKRLFGSTVGLVAAALMAVFPGAIEHSQYNKADAVLYFTAVASVLVTLRYYEKGGTKLAVAGGIAIGAVVSSKYNGVLVAAPFVVAAALRHGRKLLVRPDLYLAGMASVLTFVLINLYFLADFPRFIDHVAFDIYSYSYSGRGGAEGENNWLHHAIYTWRFGAGRLASIFGLAGLALALYRPDGRMAIFLSFPVIFYAHYSSQKINWPDNLITIYPFLALLAAHFLDEGLRFVGSLKWGARYARYRLAAVGVVLALMMWQPLGTTIRFNERLTLPDTGNLAREWLNGAFPPRTHFAVERHAPVPDRRKYDITMEARIVRKAVRDYRELGVDYLIVSSQVYERFGPEHRTTKAYDKLFQICPLVKEFQPVEGKLQGPTIRVLRIPTE